MKSFILSLYLFIFVPAIAFSTPTEEHVVHNMIIENKHKKLGIVLSGGGGRGSYQVGVWKYLVECGLDKDITAFSGTSIGALNTILFVQDDYELVEHVWTKEIEGKVIPRMQFFSILTSIPKAIVRFIIHGAMFGRDEFVKIVDKFVDLEKVSNDKRMIIASCSTKTSLLPLKFSPKYFELNNCDNDRIKSILFATTALAVLFEPEKIDDKKYIDGVYTSGNVFGAKTLHEHGCDAIIIVYLDNINVIKDKSAFGDTAIYEIIPQNSLGGFFTGTLDFSEKGTRKRIEMGYNDAKNVIENAFGVIEYSEFN